MDFNELLMSLTTEQNRELRKEHKITDKIKSIILNGCLNQGAYIQFHEDLRFGLRGALMGGFNYEEQGMYSPGTFLKALKEAVK